MGAQINDMKFYSQLGEDQGGDLSYELRDIRKTSYNSAKINNGTINTEILYKHVWGDLADYANNNTQLFAAGEPWILKKLLGACNITCLGMVLDYCGYMSGGPRQIIEDLFSSSQWPYYRAMAIDRVREQHGISDSIAVSAFDEENLACQFRFIEKAENLKGIAEQLYGAKVIAEADKPKGSNSLDFLQKIKETYLENQIPVIISNGIYNRYLQKKANESLPVEQKTRVLYKLGHYVVIVGMDNENVYIHDPWGKVIASRDTQLDNLIGFTYASSNPTACSSIPIDCFQWVIEASPATVIIENLTARRALFEADENDAITTISQRLIDPFEGRIKLYQPVAYDKDKFKEAVDHYIEHIDEKINEDDPDNPNADPPRLKSPLTQGFGFTQYAVKSGSYNSYGGFHNGIDIGLVSGTEIYSATNGYVYVVEDKDTGYGTNVKILDVDQELLLVYAHMTKGSYVVSVGEYVEAGQLIGKVGSTGNSGGPHLHFDVRKAYNINRSGGRYTCSSWFENEQDQDENNYLVHGAKFINPLGNLAEFYYDLGRSQSSGLNFPLVTKKSRSPLYFYYKNEVEGEGGFFPLGKNLMFHSGIHLAPLTREADDTIYAPMAGDIVAVRMVNRELLVNDSDVDDRFFDRYYKNNINLIIIRHKIAIQKSEDESESHNIYSLIMHPLEPAWSEWESSNESFYAGRFSSIPWIKKIVGGRNGIIYDLEKKASTYKQIHYPVESVPAEPGSTVLRSMIDSGRSGVRIKTDDGRIIGYKKDIEYLGDIFTNLKDGKMVTFKTAVLPVESGEPIGIVDYSNGEGFFHWEIFSSQDGGISKIIEADDELKNLFRELEDQDRAIYIDKSDQDNIKNLFNDNENIFKQYFNNLKLEMGFQSAVQLGSDWGRLYGNSTFHHSDDSSTPDEKKHKTYKMKININKEKYESAGVTLGPFRLNTVFYYDITNDSWNTTIMKTVSGNELAIDVPCDTASIVLQSNSCLISFEPETVQKDNLYEQEKKLFEEIVVSKLRNVKLKHTSLWEPEQYKILLETLYDEELPYFAQYDSAEAIYKAVFPMPWWNKSSADDNDGRFGEVQIDYDGSLFDEDLPDDGKVESINPVTLLWLIRLLKLQNKIYIEKSAPPENEVEHTGWYDVSEGSVLAAVINKNLQNGPLANDDKLIASNGDLELDLGKISFNKQGLYLVTANLNFWGSWKLKAGDAESENLVLSKPEYESCSATVLSSANGSSLQLTFNVSEPFLPEGFVFFKYKIEGEETEWQELDPALPADSSCLSLSDDCKVVTMAVNLTPAFMLIVSKLGSQFKKGDRIELQIKYTGVNGGLVQYQDQAGDNGLYSLQYSSLEGDNLAFQFPKGDGFHLLGKRINYPEIEYFLGDKEFKVKALILGKAKDANTVLKAKSGGTDLAFTSKEENLNNEYSIIIGTIGDYWNKMNTGAGGILNKTLSFEVETTPPEGFNNDEITIPEKIEYTFTPKLLESEITDYKLEDNTYTCTFIGKTQAITIERDLCLLYSKDGNEYSFNTDIFAYEIEETDVIYNNNGLHGQGSCDDKGIFIAYLTLREDHFDEDTGECKVRWGRYLTKNGVVNSVGVIGSVQIEGDVDQTGNTSGHIITISKNDF